MIKPDHKERRGFSRGLKYDHDILEQPLIEMQIFVDEKTSQHVPMGVSRIYIILLDNTYFVVQEQNTIN